MTAFDFLKKVSPNDEIGIRNDLEKANLLKHVIKIMEMYAKLKIKQNDTTK
jgi:hypothetical protein